jgi:hypothetical protein
MFGIHIGVGDTANPRAHCIFDSHTFVPLATLRITLNLSQVKSPDRASRYAH